MASWKSWHVLAAGRELGGSDCRFPLAGPQAAVGHFDAARFNHRCRITAYFRFWPPHAMLVRGIATALENGRRHKMDITRCGSKPSAKGPADWFMGTVRIDPLFDAAAPARAGGAAVTFEPGARTAWHTHPLGQTLI